MLKNRRGSIFMRFRFIACNVGCPRMMNHSAQRNAIPCCLSICGHMHLENHLRALADQLNVCMLNNISIHYYRMVQTRHYDQRPFDKIVCDAVIANGGVKNPSKKVQNICDDGCIKHGSDFSCVCDAGHMVHFN